MSKVLCVCRGGNVRSVAAKMILKRYFGHETLAVGVDNNDAKTIEMLGDWADLIALTHRDFDRHIPSRLGHKLIYLHVGTDLWGNPFHEELQAKLFDLIMSVPTLRNRKNPTKEAVLTRLRQYREKIAQRNLEDMNV